MKLGIRSFRGRLLRLADGEGLIIGGKMMTGYGKEEVGGGGRFFFPLGLFFCGVGFLTARISTDGEMEVCREWTRRGGA